MRQVRDSSHNTIDYPTEQNHGYRIIAIGSRLVADDQAGPLTYQLLQKANLPSFVKLDLLELSGFDVLDKLAGEQLLIVVDAVYLGDNVGKVHILEGNQLPRATRAAVSCHGIGLFEALEICKKLYPEKLPKQTILIGIEGRDFSTPGVPPSEKVMQGITKAAKIIQKMISCKITSAV